MPSRGLVCNELALRRTLVADSESEALAHLRLGACRTDIQAIERRASRGRVWEWLNLSRDMSIQDADFHSKRDLLLQLQRRRFCISHIVEFNLVYDLGFL